MVDTPNTGNRRSLLAVAGILAVVVAVVGVFARFAGLGERPLAVDEYYFVTSVQSILQSSMPELPGGGFYARGIFLQYIAAATALIFGPSEFSFRLPSVLFSLGVPVLMFVYARRTLGSPLATCLAGLLILSSWQIEFGRFARMYAGLQFVTIGLVLAVDRIYWGRRWRLRYVPLILAAIAVTTHELGVLLLPLVMLPFVVWRGEPFWTFPSRVRFGAVSLLVCGVLFIVSRADYANVGVTDPYPAGFEAIDGGNLVRTPAFPFWQVAEDPTINLLALCGALAATALILIAVSRYWRRLSTSVIWIVLAMATALAHNFVIALGLSAAALLRSAREPAAERRRVRTGAWTVLGVMVAWIFVALVFRSQLLDVTGRTRILGALRVAFLGWPDFYTPLLVPWAQDLPLLGLAIGAAVGVQLVHVVRQSLVNGIRNPAVLIAYVCCAVAVLNSPYASTRYTFFVYPFGLYAMFVTALELSNWAVDRAARSVRPLAMSIAAGVVLMVFALSRDFNPHHIKDVRTDSVTFRTAQYASYESLWYPRRDHRSAAQFLEREAAGRDPIIAVGIPEIAYYLDEPHALFLARSDRRFSDQSRRSGTMTAWSRTRLLSTEAELRAFVGDSQRLWIVWSAAPDTHPFDPTHAWLDRLVDVRTVFVTADSSYAVAEIRLGPP